MKINTELISGAGNTFHIYFLNNDSDIDSSHRPQIAQVFCEKFKADGFVFLKNNLNESMYEWDFYNNDGSNAEMCGNAARCVGYYIQNILKDKGPFYRLKTVAGVMNITPENQNNYLVQTSPVLKLTHSKYFFCNTGVPHLVIPIKNNESFESYKEFCKQLRISDDFKPQGTNVTLLKENALTQSLTCSAVTYERGVEDFTLACGTGALAVGFYCLEKYSFKKIRVEMPGGTLMIDMSNVIKPLMLGPAVSVRSCQYELE